MRDSATRTEALRILRDNGRLKTFNSRQTIFARGDKGDSMAIVEKGVVRISVFSADGRELALALLGPGDVIGEISAIDRQERTADVVAAGNVTVTMITAQQCRELIHAHTEVTDFFMAVLCSRIRTANAHAESYALNSLAGRLTIYFMNHGEEQEDGTIALRDLPSQSELARLVGVTRESVNRQFRSWRDQSLLLPADSGFVVPDPVRLQESALAE